MKKLLPIATIALIAVCTFVLVQCDELTGGAPLNIKIVADTDSTLTISWSAPTEGTPDKYMVGFMETGTASYTTIGEPTATELMHDPAGMTGTYKVTAVFGSSEYDGAITPTTMPIATVETAVGELNGAELAGYGWGRATGAGATYTMTQASSAASVDFYITDWEIGYDGPSYYIASPDITPDDPGNVGVVPPASWAINAFSDPLGSLQGPIPHHESGINYFDNTELTADPTVVACHTADDYYGLVKVGSFNTGTGEVKVESWFQTIMGLRLIQH